MTKANDLSRMSRGELIGERTRLRSKFFQLRATRPLDIVEMEAVVFRTRQVSNELKARSQPRGRIKGFRRQWGTRQ